MTYKIKGKGDCRDVYNEAGVLVGRLVRHERPVTKTTHTFDRHGRVASIFVSKTNEVWWRAHDVNGVRLGRAYEDVGWRGASRQTLKDWTDPLAWDGLLPEVTP